MIDSSAHRQPPPVAPLSQRTGTRQLHLVDLDEVIGGPRHYDRVVPTLAAYLRAACFSPRDHLVIAAERRLATAVAFDLPSPSRLIVAVGPDGIGRRLVEEYPAEFVARRYDRLVIGSGDSRFTELAAELSASGIPVAVVVSPGSTAAQNIPLHPVAAVAA